jgi:hypothetical protein
MILISLVLGFFKSPSINSSLISNWQDNGTLHKRLCTFMITSCWILLRMRDISDSFFIVMFYFIYYQQLHLKYLCNFARYWLQAPCGWHDSVETCRRSVIICEIIVHLLVIVQEIILNYITDSCIWHTGVTWQGTDCDLPVDDTIVSKHVGGVR